MRVGDVANEDAAKFGKPLDGVRVLALEQMQALPYATQLLARSTPPLDELVGHARRTHQLGDDRCGGVGADDEGSRGIAPAGFFPAAGEAGAHVASDDQRGVGAAGEREEQRADR